MRTLSASLLALMFVGCVRNEPDAHGEGDALPEGVGAARSELTVGDVAAGAGCSTESVQGVSEQLMQEMLCRTGGMLMRFEHANVQLSSSWIHPYMAPDAVAALYEAADNATTPIRINSAMRSVVDQYVLKASCSIAAEPGRSNHETGRAIDVSNWSDQLTVLTNAGFMRPLPDSDRVHFEFLDAPDLRAETVEVFQHLWNLNHPTDLLTEDGIAGPQTKARIAMTPTTGFAIAGDCVVCTPTTEICNGEDDDCDGSTDEDSVCNAPDMGVPDMNVAEPDLGTPQEDPDMSVEPGPEPDAGIGRPRDTKVASGCDCSVDQKPSWSSAWLTLVVAALMARKRRSLR